MTDTQRVGTSLEPAGRSEILEDKPLREGLEHHARYSLAKSRDALTTREWFRTVALTVRDRLVDGLIRTEDRYSAAGAKRLYYLSMEFLIGRSLANNLLNLGIFEQCEASLREMGVDLEEIRRTEPDAALGNGG